MSDKKHIDRLFQEKLKDFEAAPSDAVWEHIHARLHKDERKRRVIPIWWKFAGVAALLALLLTIGVKFILNDVNSDINYPIVDTQKKSFDTPNDASKKNSNSSETSDKQSDNSSKIANEDVNSDNPANDGSNEVTDFNAKEYRGSNASDLNKTKVATNFEKKSNQKNDSETSNSVNRSSQDYNLNHTQDAVANLRKSDEQKASQKDKLNNTKEGVADYNIQRKYDSLYFINRREKSESDKLINDSKNKNSLTVTDASKKMEEILTEEIKQEEKTENSIEAAIAQANTEEEKDEKEKKLNRWNISPNVAPVYFNSLGKGSTLDQQFVENTNDGEVTISYGVGGSYALNDRLKLRAGINKVDMGYSTNNVIAFRNIDASSITKSQMVNVSINDTAENMTYLSAESLNSNVTPEIINTKTNGSINQRFGFIEMPLEMEYALIKTKLGINVIGGFSTLIVDKNEIYSVVDGAETRIGEANNINNMSYSANFGLGISYYISEKIKVNVEPTFKYQINTFNNSSGDFQPYFIGLYTGLSYKF